MAAAAGIVSSNCAGTASRSGSESSRRLSHRRDEQRRGPDMVSSMDLVPRRPRLSSHSPPPPPPPLLPLLSLLSLLLLLSYALQGHAAASNSLEIAGPQKGWIERAVRQVGRGLERRAEREREREGEGDGDGEEEGEGEHSADAAHSRRDTGLWRRSTQAKIIGGQPASISLLPFQASIRRKIDDDLFHWCGGILVHPQYVVSAAHCVFSEGRNTSEARIAASEFVVVLGSSSLLTGGRRVLVSQIWTHPDYIVESNGVLVNDVALLKLATRMPITASITPIKIAFDDRKLKQFSDIGISGFGVNDTLLAQESEVLRAATVDYLPTGCDGYVHFNPKVILCAGCQNGSVDTCTGDSGGPATTSSASGGCPILVGVTSFGRDCALAGFPGGYARIAAFVDWLEKQAQVSFRSQYDISPTRYCDKCTRHTTLSCGAVPRFNATRCQLEAWTGFAFKFVLRPCSTTGPNRLSVARVEAFFLPSSFGSLSTPSGGVYFLQGRPGGSRLVSIGGVRVTVPLSGKVVAQKGKLVKKGVWGTTWQTKRQRFPTRACTSFYSYVAVFVSADRRIVQASLPAAYSAAN